MNHHLKLIVEKVKFESMSIQIEEESKNQVESVGEMIDKGIDGSLVLISDGSGSDLSDEDLDNVEKDLLDEIDEG